MDRVTDRAPSSPPSPAEPPSEAARPLLAPLLSAEGQALLAELRDHDPAGELALATRLRRDHPAELVSAALAQARLRQRAVAKFGADDAYRMYFTPHGVEQATRSSVAAHRAARLVALTRATPGRAVRVTDLCCGIGGDAIELARAGFAVTAVDIDPLTCEIARTNVRTLAPGGPPATVTRADVRKYDTAGAEVLFIDPARRGGRGRIFNPEAYSPPLSWAIEAVRRVGTGAVKIAPGIPHELVPDDFEAEWISDGGDVKEAVLWHHPAVVPGTRRATLLTPAPVTLTGRGLPDPPVRPAGRYLYEPDGAVIRAHLVAEVAEELAGGLLDATIAYITADEARETPYATAYEITDELPFSLKRLKALLREREVGVLTVKKRGSAVEPEELRRRMKLKGPHAATVFLTRVAGAPTMLLGHPVSRPDRTAGTAQARSVSSSA
ncbi:class I SAM-dependent methyltransferase [Streptomyces paludis]|uniref:Class I SAM-dependent methyltransferase n=1 Tax=Streptomyces paludis TaxID=2282738 RepID=A0A345HSU0_9ACTN|nr:class I SAM-dependent methyltransferase [Streptomyces paludis]AXG79764.1 class I SAM-dependent methyltransferase [Streptomyces paludis]